MWEPIRENVAANFSANFSQLLAVTETRPVIAPVSPIASVTHLAQRLYCALPSSKAFFPQLLDHSRRVCHLGPSLNDSRLQFIGNETLHHGKLDIRFRALLSYASNLVDGGWHSNKEYWRRRQ